LSSKSASSMIYEQQVTLRTGVMMLKIQQFIERMRLRRQKVQLFCRDQMVLYLLGHTALLPKPRTETHNRS